MVFRKNFDVLLALLFAICVVQAIPTKQNATNEKVSASTSTSTSKPEMKNEVMMMNATTKVVQGKQFQIQASDLEDDNQDSSVNPNFITAIIPANLALRGLNNEQQIINYLPLNSPQGGALIFPAGAVRIIGQAHVSLREQSEDDDGDDDYNELNEEERAIRRRRRIRKRNNAGSLERRRRRKGDNEIRRENYNVLMNGQGTRRRQGSSENRRRPQRRRPAYDDYDY